MGSKIGKRPKTLEDAHEKRMETQLAMTCTLGRIRGKVMRLWQGQSLGLRYEENQTQTLRARKNGTDL